MLTILYEDHSSSLADDFRNILESLLERFQDIQVEVRLLMLSWGRNFIIAHPLEAERLHMLGLLSCRSRRV